jgi:hypothetical protein
MPIIYNAIKCKHCKNLVVAPIEGTKDCPCGKCGAGGGLSSLPERKGKMDVDYEEKGKAMINGTIWNLETIIKKRKKG